MRILVYEHLTALGEGREPGHPMHSMYREGLAMRGALAADLAVIDDIEVVFSEPHDAAIVIAPETDGILLRVSEQIPDVIGPSRAALELSSDKLALAEHWRLHGVVTPATTDRRPTVCENFPVVWKPRDGCGSTDTFLIRDRFELAAALAKSLEGKRILQPFASGRAASVAFLCGPGGYFPMIPAMQYLSEDGRFRYLGGELPIEPGLAKRAIALASKAIACIPGLRGYVGVDLVLGDVDYAIEINPRLTTSYVGLRALAMFNVAEQMLRIARGESPTAMQWRSGGVRFTPDGTVASVGQV